MRNFILALTLLVATISNAQTPLIDNAVTFEQVKAIKEKSESKTLNGSGITQYTALNGSIIKIGDKFHINRPEGGSKVFVSITNKPTVMDDLSGTFNPSVLTNMSNTEITIKKLYVWGMKRTGFKMFAELETCGTCNNLLVDIELAIETKEIRSNGMTKEEAIAKLKESKDLLDLGMIKQEEFDKLKAELTPIIMK
ncbi:hypothetical protein [Flavobacterium ammonificans]|uniref:SHOCT domain-containing protein n=1 Tax=Flavobacterium ammonificans TaxID=1751056 RepID=A0ABM7UXB7_9FLAO|nr:hypothetical protein [Flavobacterium ammonificans]BDB52024.1 hypothetical protein GENT11_03360 [Flavobacterium ammonificans]